MANLIQPKQSVPEIEQVDNNEVIPQSKQNIEYFEDGVDNSKADKKRVGIFDPIKSLNKGLYIITIIFILLTIFLSGLLIDVYLNGSSQVTIETTN